MLRKESIRLHLDWWKKCRTCKWWSSDEERWNPGKCLCHNSDMFNKETWIEGHCKKWDSFDEEVANLVIEDEEKCINEIGNE